MVPRTPHRPITRRQLALVLIALAWLAALAFAGTVGAAPPAQELAVAPALRYGSFLGGASDDSARAVAVDAQGNIIIAGSTYSTGFPGQAGTRNDTNVFVIKLNPNGSTLLYSVMLSGSDDEEGLALAVDAQGNAWVTGWTESADFPIHNAIDSSLNGDSRDTFVAKISPTGAILAASYLGDEGNDQGRSIAIDAAGNAYIAGEASAQFGPVAFVRKLAADARAQIYLGSFGQAERGFLKGTSAYDIAVDTQGRAYVVGQTNTYAFPEVRALYPGCVDDGAGDCADQQGFITVIAPDGRNIEFSSYLGGTNNDEARAVAVDGQGNIVITGMTFSVDFPTAGAHVQPKRGLDSFADVFIIQLAPLGTATTFSTFYGGAAWEEPHAISLDRDGTIVISGQTSSGDLPLRDPVQSAISGLCLVGSNERYCYDAFVARFSPAGALTWASYLGGSADDIGYAVTTGPGNTVYVAGRAESSNLPTTAGALQPHKGFADDAFVVQLGPNGDTQQPELNQRIYLPIVVR